MSVIEFLDQQACAVALFARGGVLVGVGSKFCTFSETLELQTETELAKNDETINRLVSVGDSFYFSTSSGSAGFVRDDGGAEIAVEQPNLVAIDSDIHSSGHIAALLCSDSFQLADPIRGSIVGKVPLGATGTPNGLRMIDSSLVAIASAVVSLFDVRTPQSKAGVPACVLEGPRHGGRTYTCLDSDSMHWLVGGDSAGEVVLWDARLPGIMLKNVHAHAGAVLAASINGGLVGSTSADGSVALWTVEQEGRSKKKKSRKHTMLSEMTTETLQRSAVEGGGAGLGICVDEKRVVYVTDTGVVCNMIT